MALNSLAFYCKLRILRWLTRVLAWLDGRRHPTSSLIPSSRVPVASTLSKSQGSFDVFFYHPPGLNQMTAKKAQYPIVIVLHGGGWCVGHARHDERFIATLTARGAVVAAVNYRLAPEHPYPTPLLDCLDAILHIWKNAANMGLDKHRTFITGFSVGGQMAFALLFMLWQALLDKDPRIDPATLGTVKGVTAFYPPMDLTKTRPERAASNPDFVALKKKPASSSRLVGDIFDRAYFWNLREMPHKGQMYLSPGLAPSEVIQMALPERIFIKPAGLDPLLAEGNAAAVRLKELGKRVNCEVIEGVPHYWDHLAKTDYEKSLRETVYGKAADEIEEVLAMKSDP
ncbi:Alpha/Beta hydrolase protein [Aspergillus ambiguus]|uniref:Alpha/Beta hydrolase protein n=1 Tax=Aspergillus ambiguus TaxID=176160 RepID=UPI003CCCF1D1